jgi:hypothetical protein
VSPAPHRLEPNGAWPTLPSGEDLDGRCKAIARALQLSSCDSRATSYAYIFLLNEPPRDRLKTQDRLAFSYDPPTCPSSSSLPQPP